MSHLNSPPQTISVRLEKLHFLVEELVLAAALANHATDSDMARMLSRHVAIRIPDFIEHARQLRNSLVASPSSAKFKGTVNAFADAFSEYLKLTRHKLGAHVQDIDFVERIDLWVSIDTSKIEYFVQGARELWDSLGELGVPGHQPFATPASLASPSAASVLDYLARDVEIPVTFGTDALAFARANSQTLFNNSPVHQRAGQLALLRRWIRAERELFALFKPHTSIARILKARILTDIVSFHDCLITRPVQAGAPQQMDGLDALIVAAGKQPIAIQAFVASNRDDTTVDPIRQVRNRIGGHLEIDSGVPLSALLAQLDSFDLAGAECHYARLEATFVQTCRQVEFLMTHLMDGHQVGGMLVNQAKVAPFDRSRPDIIAGAPAAPTYSQAEMQEQLKRWEGGAGPFAAAVLDYFRDAFSHAPLATQRERVEKFGSGKPTLDDPYDEYEQNLTVSFQPQRIAVVDGAGKELWSCTPDFPAPNSPPRPKSDPATWVMEFDYPYSAKRENRQGVVQFALAIDASGSVTACKITSSSGYADLDQAACSVMRRRAQFKPATDANGNAIEGTWVSSVRWTL